jgi:hypothetical protein
LSTASPITLMFRPLLDRLVIPGQLAIPDSASAQLNVTVTAVLFQPAAFGAGLPEPEMVGAVLSSFTGTLTARATLPALSVHEPWVLLLTCVVASAVTSWADDAMFVATPETRSVQPNETLTSDMFQPSAFCAGE